MSSPCPAHRLPDRKWGQIRANYGSPGAILIVISFYPVPRKDYGIVRNATIASLDSYVSLHSENMWELFIIALLAVPPSREENQWVRPQGELLLMYLLPEPGHRAVRSLVFWRPLAER